MPDIAVETKALTKTFNSFTAVKDLSLQIESGSVYGFLGPNGSGKSTTIRMLCGLLAPSSGDALVLGMKLPADAKKLRNRIGYMSQKFSLYHDLTVLENIELYAGLYSLSGRTKKSRVEQTLEFAELEYRQNDMVAILPGGLKQHLALGCSIMHNPEVLFLDEPTGGADPKIRRTFWKAIYDLSERGTTIMVTTHFMDEAEYCSKVALVYSGSIIADDTPESLKNSMPFRIYEVTGDDNLSLFSRLKADKVPHVLSVDFFGSSLHIAVDTTHREPPYFDGYETTEITPSMEDVFVHLIKSNRDKLSG